MFLSGSALPVHQVEPGKVKVVHLAVHCLGVHPIVKPQQDGLLLKAFLFSHVNCMISSWSRVAVPMKPVWPCVTIRNRPNYLRIQHEPTRVFGAEVGPLNLGFVSYCQWHWVGATLATSI